MKKYHLFFVVGSTMLMTAISCQNNATKTDPKTDVQAENVEVYYTCTMHPEVQSDKPGKCPKCGMELVEVKNTKPDSIQQTQHSDSMHNNK